MEAPKEPSALGQYVPPVAELLNEIVASAGTDPYEQVGEPWLGMNESHMPPVVQKAIRSRRFSADISQGTEQTDLAGEPEQSLSVPVPRTLTSLPAGPVPVPPSADDKISASRKRRRRFSEYQRRRNHSSSSDSQASPVRSDALI
jgi:hypothetical protein